MTVTQRLRIWLLGEPFSPLPFYKETMKMNFIWSASETIWVNLTEFWCSQNCTMLDSMYYKMYEHNEAMRTSLSLYLPPWWLVSVSNGFDALVLTKYKGYIYSAIQHEARKIMQFIKTPRHKWNHQIHSNSQSHFRSRPGKIHNSPLHPMAKFNR